MALTWNPVGTDIIGTATSQQFGHSVATSSDGFVVAVGAYGANSNIGAVRVYAYNGTSWVQRGSDISPGIISSPAQTNTYFFGQSVALSADGLRLAVGAPLIDVWTNDTPNIDAGRVYVYDWNGTSWQQQGNSIDGSIYSFQGEQSGFSVALSSNGNTVAIGSPAAYSSDMGTGCIRIYTLSDGSWVQKGTTIFRGGNSDANNFGFSISLSSDGNVVAGGAPAYKGSVSVFAWNGTAWIKRGEDILGGLGITYMGTSVSLSASGTSIVIGAQFNSVVPVNSGNVFVYDWTGTSWVKRGITISGEAAGDQFGRSVAMSADGTIIAAGSPNYDASGISNSGAIRVFQWNTETSSWVQYGPTLLGIASASSGFGTGLAMSSDGTYIVGGAPIFNTNTGYVRVYSYPTVSPPIPEGSGPVPCFFGNARVLTPHGYRRMDSLVAGDVVLTPEGSTAAIERVKITVCSAGLHTNPYVIPAGTFGATRRLLISPDHKVCLADGRRVEAKRLGLAQEDREGTLTYYNLELAGQADMVVSGVPVESLAPVRRVVVRFADFAAAMRARYGELTPAVLAAVQRTCRFVGPDTVEVPMVRRR